MQLSFDFPVQDKYLLEDFIVSESNKQVFEFIQSYRIDHHNVPRIFAIVADKSSGKTYLANLWQKRMSAEFLNLEHLENTNLVKFIEQKKCYIIEDIDKVKNQELLLHIFNVIQEKHSFLLLTSSVGLNRVGLKINDLNSRLRNVPQLEIAKMDDYLIKMLLIKNFADKQLVVRDKVINFLAKNLQRNYIAVFDAVRLLEFYSLEKGCNITIPLIREVLKKPNN